MRTLIGIFLVLFSLPVFPQSVEAGSLAKKLVEGSPWRFSTRYESTVHEFRLTEDGRLQRKSPNKGAWSDETVLPNQTIQYQTIGGHVITYQLDRDGSATATHSKHSSQFKSEKN